MTYRTSNVARLAGAATLLAVLAVSGLVTLATAGETTASTWALGLAAMVPTSAVLLAVTANRSPPRTGKEYALGLLAGAVALSVAYLAVAAADTTLVRAVAGFELLELVAVAFVFALLAGALVLVDARYVERPVTAALLEERHLDEPVRGD